MLRRSGGRRRAQLDEEEDERVVYYDLDAGSHSRNLLLSPDAAAAPAQPRASAVNEADGSHIFPRQQQPLFNLDDSADEAEEKEQQEQENPFATLIQQQQTHKPAATERTSTRSQAGGRANSFLQVDTRTEDAGRRPAATSSNAVGRSILKRSQPHNGVATTRGVNKKLSFEAADSRPARWSTQKPSAADTKNRRKSLSAIQKRRSQLEAASAKRRKSMSPTLSGPSTTQSVEESRDGSRPAPKRRLLSDVLQRATLLSQQSTGNDESALSHSQTADPTDGDAILDTEHQMRAEPFAPQIFSPSKPAPAAGTKHSWKSKSDGLVSKVRGSVGDVLRKALRKSHRDLTLLRSRGQHLLSQQSNNSSSMGTVGAVETIQERGFIVVCLQQCCAGTSQFAAYKCNIREVAAKVEKTTAASLTKSSGALEALFQPQTAEFLKLAPGKSVKLYEPLHVVAEHVAAGSTKKPRWFLLSTQLAEVVDDNF